MFKEVYNVLNEVRRSVRKELLKYKCDHKLGYYQLSLEVGISASAVRMFLLNKSNTKMSTLAKISQFLNSKVLK